MTKNTGMWGVSTDYPDTVSVTVSDAMVLALDTFIADGFVKRTVGDDFTDFQVSNLRFMYDVLEGCFRAFPDNTKLQTARKRVVTEACDKLCAQEHFLGDNAMSKQAVCHECGCEKLQTISSPYWC
eukprot:1301071-Rhodomonas_salina.1